MKEQIKSKVVRLDYQEDLFQSLASGMTSYSDQENALLAEIQANPAMLNDPETKAVYEEITKTSSEPVTVKASVTIPAQQQQTTVQPQQVEAPILNGTLPAVATEEQVINNSLFFEEQKNVDFSKATEQNLQAVVNETFGLDTSKPEWVKNFLSDYHANSLAVKSLSEIKQKYEQVNEELQNVPVPLLHAMTASLAGKNWRDELKNFDIDYTNKFEEMSVDEQLRVTKRLVPDLVVDDTDRNSAQFKAILNIGKNSFDVHKKSIENEFQKLQEKQASDKRAYNVHVDKSIENLSKKFSEFKNEENLKDIKKMLLEKAVHRLFYDNKGNPLEDAAEKLVYALHGSKLVEKAKAASSTKKANEVIANVIIGSQTRGVSSTENNNITERQNTIQSEVDFMIDSYKDVYANNPSLSK